MKPKRASADTVLRWLSEDPARNSKMASAHFGISDATIRSWTKRARDEGRARPTNLTVLPPNAQAPAADLAALEAMRPSELVKIAMLRRLIRMAEPIDETVESSADSVKIVNGLADRVAIFEGMDPAQEVNPTSEAGRTALLEALKSVPKDLLRLAVAS